MTITIFTDLQQNDQIYLENKMKKKLKYPGVVFKKRSITPNVAKALFEPGSSVKVRHVLVT